MYTRELQNNMSILNVFKQTGQASKKNMTTHFSDVIGKRYQSSALNRKDITLYNQQTDNKTKSTFKSTISNQSLKNNASLNEHKKSEYNLADTKTDIKTDANLDANSDKKTDVSHAKTDTNNKEIESKFSNTKDVASNDEQTIKDALAEKLKVSADELDQLMALMDVDLTELQQLVSSESLDVNLLQEICTTLSQIEISSSLDETQNLDETLVDKLADQFKSLMTSLQNQQTGMNKNDESGVRDFIDKLETLLKQPEQSGVKTVIANDEQTTQTVDLSEEEVTVLFDKIKALTAKSNDHTSNTEVKTSATKSDTQSASQTETGIKTEAVENANKVVASKLVDTSDGKNAKESALEHKSEQSETVVSVSKEGDLVITKSTSETNSILDQITLKQPSSITNGTQTSASSALRSNIFSQVMDAVQTNIKLDDNGSHMLMKLNPEQLGSVELKISIHKGVVLAEINVENEMVKATVESNLDDLKQSLSQKGYQLNQINVSIDSGKKEQEQQFAFNKSSKSKRGVAIDETGDLEALLLENTNYQDDPYDTSTINYYA